MDFFKKIAIGVIVGLILMLSRKYLFINASAMTSSDIVLDTYRFTNSNNTYSQVNYSGKNANLPATTLGSSNAGALRYFFHSPTDLTLSTGQVVYFSIGTSLMYNDGNQLNDFLNTSFSIGTNGTLIGSNGASAICEVSSSSSDLDTVMTYKPTKETTSGTAVYSPYYFVQEFHNVDFRFVQTYKCTIDEELTLSTTTNTSSFISPNLMYGYGPWGFYSRGYSSMQVVSGFENIIISNQQTANNALDDIKDSDISSSSKESVDDSDLNDYISTESDLFDSTSSNYSVEDTLDVGLDANGSQFLWSTITSFIQTHAKVFGCVISMLSLGIIKLALGR